MANMRIAGFAVLGLLLGAGNQAQAVSPPAVEARTAMVVTAQREATMVGTEIMREGGNAIDAAVAVGYALAVVLPCCGNIGGGGFATLHLADGRDVFVNSREKAPEAATATMYLDATGEVIPDLSRLGYKAVAVPGTVLGLDNMLREFGTMSRSQVMAPAIRLAEDGFVLTAGDAGILKNAAKALNQEPNVAAIFLRDGQPWQAGERLVQKDLAVTLKAIAKEGASAFYKGPVAATIVAASSANGGLLTLQDFADYSVTESAPIRCSYRGYTIISAPPPSSGGTALCEMLNILEGYPMAELGFHSAQGIHLMVEAMRHAYLDRNFELGDPAFVKSPLERLLSKDYAGRIRTQISADKAGNSQDIKPGVPPHEGTETTHYSIVDRAGNAVAVTYTINANFGAKVMAGNTGVLLNDEMDDFTIKPGTANMFGLVQGQKNAIAAGKRPLSSMSPTIVTRDGHLFMVLGSPGGSRIITTILEVVMNVADYGLDPQTAVDAPRFHHQWLPDEISLEPMALSPDTKAVLTKMGYKLKEESNWGAAEAIVVGPAQGDDNNAVTAGKLNPGMIYGVNDNRRPAGAAVGIP